MKLAREDKKAQKLSKPSSILKKKSSFDVKSKTKPQSKHDLLVAYSDSDSDDHGTDNLKINDSQTKSKLASSRHSSVRKSGKKSKRSTGPTFDTSSEPSEKSLQIGGSLGSQNAKNEAHDEKIESDVMIEFEELLEYTPPLDDVVERKSERAAENSPTPTAAPIKTKKKAKDARNHAMTSSSRMSDEVINEVEQVSYEARLAKLILLRKCRKTNVRRDEIEKQSKVDFSPGLAFQESLIDDSALTSSRNSDKDIGEVSSVPSLKDVLKRKRAKKKQKLADTDKGVEEDCYWA